MQSDGAKNKKNLMKDGLLEVFAGISVTSKKKKRKKIVPLSYGEFTMVISPPGIEPGT